MYGTIWALLPPVVAIALALITKEVYSSLFIGILTGALLINGFAPIATLDTVINDGFISSVADAFYKYCLSDAVSFSPPRRLKLSRSTSGQGNHIAFVLRVLEVERSTYYAHVNKLKEADSQGRPSRTRLLLSM